MASQEDSAIGDTDGLDSVVRDMLRDFKLSADAESDNRTRALFIQDFIRPGADQWTQQQITARGSRATYSFNQLPKFGRQVINDMWQNFPQIKYIPNNDTNKDKATVLEDKVREVQASGSAQTAYKLAIKSQVNIGWGYFAFGTIYANEEDFNQNIVLRQIPNTLQIYDDPATVEQDRSDRRYLIEVEDVPRSDFNRDYEDDGISCTSAELTSIGDSYPDWASVGKDIIRIGHYWRMEYTRSQLWRNKKTGKVVDEKPKDKNNYDVREIKTPRVMYYKCTAREKLEERQWEGSYIPFCFVEGNKDTVDGKVYYTGLYEDMVSTQVLYNYATNTAIELAESAPISPFMGDIRAFKGFEQFYDNANVKNFSYLPYNAVADDGSQIAQPQRAQNTADLSAAVQLIQMSDQNFYGTSGIYPASLGQQSNEKSGKAIIARQREGDVSTSNYPDAFGRALLYGGIIFKDLSKRIFDGAREIQVMSEDKKTRTVKINQKFTDEKTGKPMNYDLTEGEYEVMVSTGPSYTTKREEAREAQIQLFQAAPGPMLPALPNIIRNMDYPGADKDADAVERGLPPELRDPQQVNDQMKDIPPAVAQQIMQGKQVIQALSQQLEQAQAAATDKQAENQAKLGDMQIKAQTAQNQQQKDQYEAEYKMAQIQFDREKLATETMLEQENLKLEWAKLQLGNAGSGKQVRQMPTSDADDNATIPANLGENAMQGHMLDQQAKQITAAMKEEQQRAIDEQNQNTETQLKITEINQQQKNADMIVNILGALVQSVGALNHAVTQPKAAIKAANGEWIVAPVSAQILVN